MTAVAELLPRAVWQQREADHLERCEALFGADLRRRQRGEKHPIDDFLWQYYSFRPGQLRTWHAGHGIVLTGATAADRRRDYRDTGTPGNGRIVDTEQILALRGATIGRTLRLLSAVQGRSPQLGCFGLHEWAMVYAEPDLRRHPAPLRLGAAGTDEVVRDGQLRCSHVDAFRFFTEQAKPLNQFTPTRDNQLDLDQPGCLHVSMDVYKAAYKLSPLLDSALVLDCFALAREIRWLDMAASPYDLADHGCEPVRIETPQGRAEYVRRQRTFADRAGQLRARILTAAGAFTTQDW